jgi:predicted nucleotidyltransferase
MITDIFNKDIVKILTLFSISPGSKFSRKEIKEKIFLNNVPLDYALSILLNNRFLMKKNRFLELNFENKNLRGLMDAVRKEHLRFKEIPVNAYYLVLDMSHFLSKMKAANAYLFGSYSKLIYTEKSDIDLAVVLEGKDIVKKIKKEASKLEAKYNKTVELHFFGRKDMEQKDPIIREILRNGIVLFE